jgi:hypothetical protein
VNAMMIGENIIRLSSDAQIIRNGQSNAGRNDHSGRVNAPDPRCDRSSAQGGKIYDRLDLEEVPQLRVARRVAIDKLLPGKRPRSIAKDIGQGVARERERPHQLIEADLLRLHAGGDQRERPHHGAQARIACKNSDERLGLDQAGGGFFHVGKGLKQKAVAFEEFAVALLALRPPGLHAQEHHARHHAYYQN